MFDINNQKVSDWSICNVPVLCIFDDQVPSKTMHNVIIHNFIPHLVLGFVVTEAVMIDEDA